MQLCTVLSCKPIVKYGNSPSCLSAPLLSSPSSPRQSWPSSPVCLVTFCPRKRCCLPSRWWLMPPESHHVLTSGPSTLKDLLLCPFMNRKFVLSPAQVGSVGTSRNPLPAPWLSPSWTGGINAQNLLFIPNCHHPGWGRWLPPSEKFHR